ncbi:hypothetical protein FHG87_015879 [Trinorchestia longiramus]|nr:hypothetical protein FHG87_015879 [Trinorchestia longiramus]
MWLSSSPRVEESFPGASTRHPSLNAGSGNGKNSSGKAHPESSSLANLQDKTLLSLSSFRTVFGNPNSFATKKFEDWSDILSRWYGYYQDVAGISEVRRAQERVNSLIDDMSRLSAHRQELQITISDLHHDLNRVHSRISKSTPYSEEHTQLFEQARHLYSNLESNKKEFELMEMRERDCLTNVMSAIRVSHEKERTQQQHTNYRTLLVSLVSAAVASVVAILTNMKRTRDTHSRIQQTEQHASELHSLALQHTDALHSDTTQLITRLENSFTKYIDGVGATVVSFKASDPVAVDVSRKSVSMYQVSTYMAAGAVLGTLMTAIICGSFR